ncbi:polysaccharide lyase family 7 protein [Sediminitomix flava]|uniref:Putative secreted protein (Por secretion system target) n=1 Tax=Sediminitomix flava TaxID=379075 RepID=A0A315ZER4_SEDFL|nr:polysaccharide lyase family 7 protein [Sediminitomix flava]PWJ43214.1 putative secreted protein (Por secretion system target) [Sediminitomix flava]
MKTRLLVSHFRYAAIPSFLKGKSLFKLFSCLTLTLFLGFSTELRAQVPSDLMINCNQWKITYPDGAEDKTLCGEPNNEYFYVNNAGDAIVFYAPIRSNNGTTPNSSYIRSELREREADGSKDIYWTTEGSHMLYVKQAITHLPINKPHLVATQIHGNKADGIDDSMVMRLEGSHLFLSFNGGKLREDLTIKTDYNLGDIHEVIFLVKDGLHYCYYSEDGNLLNAYNNGTASSYLVRDGGNDYVMNLNYDQTYFKVGNYTQSNADREGSDTDDPNNYGEVYVYDFTVSHNGDTGQNVAVTGVSLSPATASLTVGGNEQLSSAVAPSNASNKSVSYSSSNTGVATVSSTGLVTAVSEGTATITVTTTDGGFTDSSVITVRAASTGSNVALNKSVTGTGTPDGTNVPANLVDGNPDTRWSVSGYPQSATIDLGAVYRIDGTELVCYGDRAYQYVIEASTNGSSYTTIVDRSNNSTPGSNSAPIVDSFSAVNARYVKITVSGAASYTGTWVSLEELSVLGEETNSTVSVSGVSLNSSSLSLSEGVTQQLSATVSPSNATNQGVSYSSNNTSVATVNSTGLVTAVSAGSATITVTTDDGGYTSTAVVSVTSNNVTAPYDIAKFQAYLAECKLQSPLSGTEATASDIMAGYSSNTFYVVNTDEIAFSQSRDAASTSQRAELRYLTNWYANNTDRTLHANLRIAEQTCDQLTVLQIHDDANEGVGNGPNKPLLRVYSSGGTLYAAVKTDAGGANTSHINMGSVPSSYFDCDIRITSGSMTVSVNGTEYVNMDISYWTFPSYWKNGVYLQDTGSATAYFNELTETIHSNGSGSTTNLALNKAVSASNEQSSNPASNLVDGDADSRWSAENYSQSATIDLGAVYSINRTEVVCFKDRAYQYIIEVSTNGSSYSTIVDRTSNTTGGSNSAPITDSFANVNARYVRLTVTGASGYSGSWISIEELSVFGSSNARIATSILSQEEEDVNVYPNPATTSLNISGASDYDRLVIYNGRGQVISTSSDLGNTVRINTENYVSGLYILRLEGRDGSVTRKVLIK